MTPALGPEDFGVALEIAGRAVVHVRGELDLATAPELEAVLCAVVEGARAPVVLDVAQLRFIDATGLGVLARAAVALRSSGASLVVRSPGATFRRLLDLTGMAGVLEVEAAGRDRPPGLERATALPADRAVVDAALRLVVAVATAAVHGADGASVSLARDGRLRTVAATDEVVSGMDSDQYALGEGPCLEAAGTGSVVHVPALVDERRWPGFVVRARERGIQSILSIPLETSGAPAGALNIYSFDAGSLVGGEQELAELFAFQASQVLVDAGSDVDEEQAATRLQDALLSREAIALAQGVLMQRDGTTAHEAYRRLLGSSRRTNRTVRELAEDIVTSVAAGGASPTRAVGRDADEPIG